MNGVSPFNYRKLTPEQEKRGEKIATVVGAFFAILWVGIAVGYLIHEALRHAQ